MTLRLMAKRKVSPLGMTLRSLREVARLDQRELARQARVDVSAINRLENGASQSMRSENLAAVAQVLGTTTDAMLAAAREGADVTPERRWPTLQEWLAHDRNLTDVQRDSLLVHYLSYVDPRRARD